MTSPEANEFFAQRTEEEVGSAPDTNTHHKRLQTERPERRTKGRVVFTLHYDVPRDQWELGDTDATDGLRRMVAGIEDIAAFLNDQFDSSLVVNTTIDVAK